MATISYNTTPPDYNYQVSISGVVVEGEIYTVRAIIYDPTGKTALISSYTALSGDLVSDVVSALYASTSVAYQVSATGINYTLDLSSVRGNIYMVYVDTPASTSSGAPLLIPPSVPYGLKYLCTFDPFEGGFLDPAYFIQILQKNYDGGASNIIGGDSPAVQNWQTDDPKSPIKGSSLRMSFVNEGALPLETFLSTDDDDFKVKLYFKSQLLFEGFLVQDDFSETMVDFAHYIQLSANDNLGLLKSVPLSESNIYSFFFQEDTSIIADMATGTIITDGTIVSRIVAGDKVTITATGIIDSTYTILSKVDGSPSGSITVVAPLAADYIGTATLSFYERPSLLDKISLLSVIEMCLSVTNLEIYTYAHASIYEVTQDSTISFLKQTLIDPQTFLKDDTNYMDCYSILENIMGRFNMTLFQSKGVWNIVRWDELRYYNNILNAFIFDLYGNDLGTSVIDQPVIAGRMQPLTPEAGLQKRFLRPFINVIETFNYKQPARLLRNFDLQNLGTLLDTYTTGSGVNLQTIKEHEALWWYPSDLLISVLGTYFIRITYDYLNNEISRILVVNGDTKSYAVEANIDDTFIYTFSFKTEDSQPGNINLVMIVQLTDGTTTNYLHEDTGWETGVGYVYNIPSGDNSNEWHTVTINSSLFPVPFDGILTFYLRVADLSAPIHETYYRDIRLQYFYQINNSTKIIGHVHEDQQYQNIKQNQEESILIDVSPRNSIAGTLFLDSMTGFLQNKATEWTSAYTTSKRLGNITTFEELFWRRITRKILDGSFYVLNSPDIISMLSIIQYAELPGLTFVWGMLEVNYKTKMVTGTLWEIWHEGEVDEDLFEGYTFTYLYSVT